MPDSKSNFRKHFHLYNVYIALDFVNSSAEKKDMKLLIQLEFTFYICLLLNKKSFAIINKQLLETLRF